MARRESAEPVFIDGSAEVDGADSRRLERWSGDGRLPNLATLRDGGLTRNLTAPLGATDDSLWASFQYAESEGEHTKKRKGW